MKIIRKQLMFIIVIGIVISTLVSGYTALVSFSSISEEQSNHILKKEIELTASQLNDICQDVEATVDSLSEHCLDEFPGIAGLKTQEGAEYIDEINNLAKTLASHNEFICAVYYRFNPELLGPKAGFFASKKAHSTKLTDLKPTDLSKYSEDDAEHVAWFYEPLKAGKAIWVDQYMNLNNDILTMSYATPIYTKDGEFIGIIGVDIDMKKLYEQVSETSIYDTGFAAMLSKRGEVQYSPQPLYIDDKSISKIINSNKVEKTECYDKQKKMTVLSHKIRYGDYLLIAIANEDLYAVNKKIIFSIILITLTASLLIIAILTGLLYKLFRRFNTDTLTNVGNRNAYIEEIEDIDAEIRVGHSVRYCVIIFDINGLKRVNDELGHTKGDDLIKNAAKLIRKYFVQGDVYRVGGDEFVFLSRNNNQTSVRYTFEKFQKGMKENAKTYDMHSNDVIISAGMAMYDSSIDTCYEDTFQRADKEMYQNKTNFYKANKQFDRRKQDN